MGGGPSRRKKLHIAIQQGYLDEVIELVRSGAGPNVKFHATSPLYNAIDNQQEDIALFLLTCKPDLEIGKYADTPLLCACRKELHNVVIKLLELRADVNKSDDTGHTPLWTAVAKRSTNIVQLLLSQNNVDINKPCTASLFSNDCCSSPLVKAVRTQDDEIVHLLCRHGADVNKADARGRIPLHHACYYGRITVAALLIYYKSDLNAVDCFNKTPLYVATVARHKEIVKMLIKSGCNLNIQKSTKDLAKAFSALHVAVDLSYTHIVELLASRTEANLNLLDANCRTPLMIACDKIKCHLSEVDILLKYGASTGYTDRSGASALILALKRENVAVVERLLEEDRTDVNVADTEQTALHYAVTCGSLKILKLIIDRGVNIQCLDSNGYTPLLHSVLKNCLNETCLLLQHGADLPSDFSIIQESILFGQRAHFESMFILASHCKKFRDVVYQVLKNRTTCRSPSVITLCSAVIDNLTLPFSLKQICRDCVRTVLISKVETSILVLINVLPLPVELKKFLAFSDYSRLRDCWDLRRFTLDILIPQA